MADGQSKESVLSFLKKNFTIQRISKDEIYRSSFIEREIDNAFLSEVNKELKIPKNNLQLEIFKIERNIKTEIYFLEWEGQYFDIRDSSENQLLLVVIEPLTAYFSSNSTRLLYEILIGIGVTENDKQNNTLRYRMFVSAKENLKNPKFFNGR